ncbi:BnaCnng14090D [Brassica napus]|uniref:(rape) hypothetical protein n=1 Tax=Brassica napus TaxID=3708 RepID=A0A078I928_BRANA|nr:unnamed protein product [Brassica napus]CDY46587.1 BnaCnng14090D [Brassica napus]
MELWRKKKARKCFLKNRSMFLQKLIADWRNRRKILTDQEIYKASGLWRRREIAYNDIVLSVRNGTASAKLTDFSLAVTLPEGKSWVEEMVPAYINDTMILDYVRDLQVRGEPVEFGGDSNDIRAGQMNMFLHLALRCCRKRNEDRPKMITVAKDIKLIEQASL